MSRIVHLARHGSHAEVGKVLSGRSDIGLSAQGRAEAAALAARLAGTPLRAIYTSPRPRTRETAAFVAARHDLEIQDSDALDEIDFGEWTGAAFEDLEPDPRWKVWNAQRDQACAPGGETMVAAVARARRFVERIAEEEILCVTHCDIIRGLVASYLGLGLNRLLTFDCDPASLTTLAIGPDGGRVVTVNERPFSPA